MRMHAAPFTLKEIKLEVTHACLLRCVHCSSLADAACIRQMKWEQCRRILKEAAEMGVAEVSISGGEPLLWESLHKAVAYAVKLGIDTTLYTTGIAPRAEAIYNELKAAGLPRVVFSVFAKGSEQHEAVTLVKGSFDDTLSSIRYCIGLGFKVEIHFVPMAANYGELRSVVELAGELGASRVSVLRLVPQGRGSDYERLKLSHEANLALRKTILELREEGYDVRVGSPYNILMLKANPECCSGIDRLTVLPDLRIVPCDAFKQITAEMIGAPNLLSSLRDNSLAECWERSDYLQRIRQYLTTPFAEKCDGCNMLENCLSGCVAQKYYAYGELSKCPDPMCLDGERYIDGHGRQ
ncbi:radical SAM protein [Geobacter sulfurreducens]|uniref:radical SAM/SPASM domain-containing protein n=1 Tax=Geobacter sulfurreducens TaxID=35554 RepID=UPI001BDC4351|nr:radical SAM protein [Geobacter sulfurreducens]QVW35325.1 radical SAM protein [Geobacter sulfurreducens]